MKFQYPVSSQGCNFFSISKDHIYNNIIICSLVRIQNVLFLPFSPLPYTGRKLKGIFINIICSLSPHYTREKSEEILNFHTPFSHGVTRLPPAPPHLPIRSLPSHPFLLSHLHTDQIFRLVYLPDEKITVLTPI